MILRLVNGTADPTAKLGPARYSTPAIEHLSRWRWRLPPRQSWPRARPTRASRRLASPPRRQRIDPDPRIRPRTGFA